MLELLRMLWAFFKIGLFTIGGGYAMIPLITREMVGNGWMTAAEVADVIAIAEMTPGPFALNTATFAGMKTMGVGGAVACTFGVMLPSLIIAMLVARFFFHFQDHRLVQGALSGIRPVVVALIAYSIWPVVSLSLFPGAGHGGAAFAGIAELLSVDWRAVLVLAVSFLMLFWRKWHPILVMAAAGALGIALFRLLPMLTA